MDTKKCSVEGCKSVLAKDGPPICRECSRLAHEAAKKAQMVEFQLLHGQGLVGFAFRTPTQQMMLPAKEALAFGREIMKCARKELDKAAPRIVTPNEGIVTPFGRRTP